MLRWVAVLVVFVAWSGLALALALRPAVLPKAGGTYDAIVVLSCRVTPDGTPSSPLRARAVEAARLYHAGAAPVVVTTGGVGEHGPSEASVARDVLVELGVPFERVLLEDASTSTEENALFARRNHGGSRVLLVTDDYHAFRARRTFERFFDEVAVSPTRSPVARGRALAREVVAISAYAALGRLRLTRTDRTFVLALHESKVVAWARRERRPEPLRGAFVWEGILVSCSSDEARRLSERSHRERRQAGREDRGESPPPKLAA